MSVPTEQNARPSTVSDASTKPPAAGAAAPAPVAGGQGQTKIADVVVAKVAGIAAREVAGVHTLGGGVSRALGAVTQSVGIGDDRSQGVSVEVGEREAAVDLSLVIEYGESIPRVTREVRENIIRRIEGIVGLHVTEVNITVNDLHFAADEERSEARVA